MSKSSVFKRKVVKVNNFFSSTDSPRKSVKTTITAREANVGGGRSGCNNPIKRDEKYYDGKPRPICRGLLHGIVFFVIASVALPVFMLGIYHGAFSQKYWKLVLFLGGKGFSYGCSAVLHLFPFQSAWRLTSALKWDLAAIPISVWASSILLFGGRYDFLTVLIVGAGIVAANGILVYMQFRGHDTGLKTPEGRSDTPRIILIVLQFLGSMFYAGMHYGYRDLWFVAVIFYALAFAASIPTTWSHEKEPSSKWVPWHRPGVYGFHEDFHWLLLVADVSFMYMGLSLLWNPSSDNYQSSLRALIF